MQNSEKKMFGFSDLLSVMYKWKKFLLINIFVIVVISVVYSLLITPTYRATAMVMLPPENNGGLSGLLGGDMAQLGAKFLGISGSDEDIILGILYSRTSLEKAVNKFNLMQYYGVSDGNMTKTLKSFRNDISFDPNEFGLFEFSIINEDPQKAADIANYFVMLGDSLNTALNTENARNNRLFLEQRYQKNLDDLKAAEDSLNLFQKKYGLVAVPEVMVSAAANLEAELIQKEILLNSMKNSLSADSYIITQLNSQIRAIRNKIAQMNNQNPGNKNDVPGNMENAPDLMLEYMRLFREVEIQNKVLEFMYPMYEQAKVEENKAIPTFLIVDEATPPELKYAPKRAFIVLAFTFFMAIISLIFILRAEISLRYENYDNIILVKENNFVKKMIKLYRIKRS